MALRPRKRWNPADFAGSWPIAGEPELAHSDAYTALLGDLYRYTSEEIAGRSYLIAGHRGSGKTSLVLHAVQRLRSEALKQSVAWPFVRTMYREPIDEPPELFGRRLRPQRPLLVKIVGQSLIAPPPLQTEKEARQQEETAKAIAATAQKTTGPDAPAKADPALAENALVHITIALYRALAAEIADAAALHARAETGPQARRRAEVAAQLALILDSEPDAGVLRRYWQMLGRLERGLLWPAEAFAPQDEAKRDAIVQPWMKDQGLREIVAVSTAAQAFQICAGTVTEKSENKDTASNDQALTLSGNVVELINRVATVLAGTVVGSAALASGTSGPSAIGAGVLTWLLGSAAFGLSASRTRKQTQSMDFSFLRDRSVQTLDRELPVVIDRIRDAGLAPVFVIDELDKVDEPDEVVASIINRLKHLIADYGFFCFLTDRGYYESISRKVANGVYPTEHTYFGRRLLVTYRPTDLVHYVRNLLTSAGSQDDLPLYMFALVVTYRSKMNFADLGRALDYFITADDNGNAILKPELEGALGNRRDLRMAATMQIAIEMVTGASMFEQALNDDPDPAFIQLVTDALYIVPRAWEKPEQSAVRIDEKSITTGLLERMQGAANKGSALVIDAEDLRVIMPMVKLQAKYLTDFGELRKAIALRRHPLEEIYLQIVFEESQVGAPGLLHGTKDPDGFTFLLDTKGIRIPDPGAAPVDEEARMAIMRQLRPFVEAFIKLLAAVGVEYEALRAIGLLPVSLNARSIEEALATLRIAEQAWSPSVSMVQAEDVARTLVEHIRRNGAWLEAVLFAFVRLQRDGELATRIDGQILAAQRARLTPAALLEAIARNVAIAKTGDLGEVAADLIEMRGPAPAHVAPTADAGGLDELRRRIVAYRQSIGGR